MAEFDVQKQFHLRAAKLSLRSLAAGMTEPMSARDSFKGRHFDQEIGKMRTSGRRQRTAPSKVPFTEKEIWRGCNESCSVSRSRSSNRMCDASRHVGLPMLTRLSFAHMSTPLPRRPGSVRVLPIAGGQRIMPSVEDLSATRQLAASPISVSMRNDSAWLSVDFGVRARCRAMVLLEKLHRFILD
jgi:hypothetical protein